MQYQMFITPPAQFTRPNDSMVAYSVDDLVANSVIDTEVVPLEWQVSRMTAGRGKLRRVRLYKTNISAVGAMFRLHLFQEQPAVSSGDNSVFGLATGTTTEHYLGVVDIDMTVGAVGSSSPSSLWKAADVDPAIVFDLGPREQDRKLFGLLQAKGTYGPVALEVFQITLEIEG